MEIQNKRVGTATIRQDGATIVFDESINNLDNVEGMFHLRFKVETLLIQVEKTRKLVIFPLEVRLRM